MDVFIYAVPTQPDVVLRDPLVPPAASNDDTAMSVVLRKKKAKRAHR